jgi:uncharacterized membrane protein YphA (DoxX/SURF4 family)
VDIAIWVVQVLLALAFGMSGIMKLAQPAEKLATNMGWVKDFSPQTVKIIGLLELLAAIGLILPAVTGVLSWLTPLAALGLVALMIGAILTHLRRKEQQMMVVNAVLLLLAVFIVYGRFVAAPL